ncbi:MAG: TetR/AcrR family transcriptional regulator [Chitinophagales bacterium]|jgi:AcrR family transcriptional regulator|nr:TetR/AcrR family transcriptional regulator [Sphingobacteriales bacterium]
MVANFSFHINPHLFKKNPEESAIGREIVSNSIDLINNLGIENFTFKKLATKIQHTEATIYRYFENKQMLLLYIVSWYWHYLDFLIDYKIQNLAEPKQKIQEIISILSQNLSETKLTSYYNMAAIFEIVIREGNKVYLHTEVKEINKIQLYKPYKDLCEKISLLFQTYNSSYKFSHSLASTLVETSHLHIFFTENLPRLTDVNEENKNSYTHHFLSDLIFKSLN